MLAGLNTALLLCLALLFSALAAIPAALAADPFPAHLESTFSEYEKIAAETLLRSRAQLKSATRMEAISLERLQQLVLSQNLGVKITGMERRKANLERTKRDAVFDTIINLALNYRHQDYYARSEDIGRERRLTGESDEEDPTEDDNPVCVYINGVLINPVQCDEHYAFTIEEEYASYDKHGDHSPDVGTASLNLSRTFPWGQSIQAGLQSRWSSNKYPSLGKYSTLYAYDEGVEGYPYGDNPWTSSIYLSLSSPLPFCKDFGEDGNHNAVLRRVSDLDAIGKQCALETEASDQLALALRTWWDLAGSLSRLVVTIKARKNLEKLARHTKRLMASGERTSYAMAQVGTELQRWLNAEEEAWSNYKLLSNQMIELLDMDPSAVVFPLGFGKGSTAISDMGADMEEEMNRAFNSRPDLKMAKINLKSDKVMQTYYRKNLLPDISVFLSTSLSQDPTYWGYSSWTDSVLNLINPDSSSVYVGFVYNFPVGDRAAKSAYTQARQEKAKSQLRYDSQKDEIIREISKAATDIKATARNIGYARQSLHLRQLTYAKAMEMRDDGDGISEFELLRKFTEYTSTELQLISSTVNNQKAGIDFQWATGKILPPEWITSRALENLNRILEAEEEEQP
ncbi:TolC family protein [Maridesulfovibrio sp.]|uniref:TolC family protein n=1 Tax=Maridesulfovibrio sp. TaxID=2795000 RepID=UPI002A187E6A|nr:TolC family protein [Maridesulfovibrio sp.]